MKTIIIREKVQEQKYYQFWQKLADPGRINSVKNAKK